MVNESVRTRGRDDHAGSAVCGKCNMICVNCVAGDDNKDGSDEAEGVNHRPPRELIK